jgi:hypothetical protein
VTQGLRGGELVVTAGANLLQPGQKVRLVDTVAAQASGSAGSANASAASGAGAKR